MVGNPEGITGSGGTSGTGFRPQNYYFSAQILNGNTTNPALPGSAASCTFCQQTLYAPASKPEFNMLGDNLLADASTSPNMWISQSNGVNTPGTITIPVGIFGVNSIATMLNTTGGVTSGGTVGGNPAAYASISFQFNATDATGASGTNLLETFALINGVTQRNIISGVLGGANTLSASYSALDLGASGQTFTVKTGNEWTGVTNTANGTIIPLNTTMNLDYQIFPVLNAYKNMYLVSVSITDTGNGTVGSANFSHEVLSGLTVTTPEPSTVLMFLGGFGAIGFARLRRKQS